MADMPLDERLYNIAETVTATVEDEDAAAAIVGTLSAAADAFQAGDIETAHAQMHDALEIAAELAAAADGDTKQALDEIGRQIGACMEETAGVLLGGHIQRALG